MLEVQSNGGRYPESILYRPDKVTANIERIENQIKISIQDLSHPERWEDFWIKISELKEELDQEA
jgi:hypothetical protein